MAKLDYRTPRSEYDKLVLDELGLKRIHRSSNSYDRIINNLIDWYVNQLLISRHNKSEFSTGRLLGIEETIRFYLEERDRLVKKEDNNENYDD